MVCVPLYFRIVLAGYRRDDLLLVRFGSEHRFNYSSMDLVTSSFGLNSIVYGFYWASLI